MFLHWIKIHNHRFIEIQNIMPDYIQSYFREPYDFQLGFRKCLGYTGVPLSCGLLFFQNPRESLPIRGKCLGYTGVPLSCGLLFFQNPRESLPIRGRYGVSFVISDLCFAPVIVLLYVISWYIAPCNISTRLFLTWSVYRIRRLNTH